MNLPTIRMPLFILSLAACLLIVSCAGNFIPPGPDRSPTLPASPILEYKPELDSHLWNLNSF